VIVLEMQFLFGNLCADIFLWDKKEKIFKKAIAIFDTGAHTTHIDTDVLETLGYDLDDAASSYINTVGSDKLQVNNTVIDNIKIGGVELGAVLVNFSELPLHFPVILGLNIIKEFNLNLNFKDSMISMEPNFDINSVNSIEKFEKNNSRFGMWTLGMNNK
jgi:hypothetical protein